MGTFKQDTESESEGEIIVDKRKQRQDKRYPNTTNYNKRRNQNYEKRDFEKKQYNPQEFREQALDLLDKTGRVVINLFGGMDQNTVKDDIYDFYKNIKINAVRMYQTK